MIGLFDLEMMSSVSFSSPDVFVVSSGHMWFLCITMVMDSSSMTKIGKFYFNAVFVIQIDIGVLSYIFPGSFLLVS